MPFAPHAGSPPRRAARDGGVVRGTSAALDHRQCRETLGGARSLRKSGAGDGAVAVLHRRVAEKGKPRSGLGVAPRGASGWGNARRGSSSRHCGLARSSSDASPPSRTASPALSCISAVIAVTSKFRQPLPGAALPSANFFRFAGIIHHISSTWMRHMRARARQDMRLTP